MDRGRAITIFRFGLYYTGYAETRWWWETVVIARKILLVAIVAFGSFWVEVQIHTALGLTILMLATHQHFAPFTHRPHKWSEPPSASAYHLRDLETGSLLLVNSLIWSGV